MLILILKLILIAHKFGDHDLQQTTAVKRRRVNACRIPWIVNHTAKLQTIPWLDWDGSNILRVAFSDVTQFLRGVENGNWFA